MLRAPRSSNNFVKKTALTVAWALLATASWAGDPPVSSVSPAQTAPSVTKFLDRLPGLTAPRRTVTLAATRAGKIAEMAVEEGAFVRKGARVFLFDDRVQRARTGIAQAHAESLLEVDIAQTAWDQAIYQLDRFRQLDGDRNATSKEVTDATAIAHLRELEYHQAEFTRQQNQRMLKLEQALLDEYAGYAPFDGYVIAMHKQVGESANELEPVVTLAQVDPLQVTVDVPLDRARSINIGQQIEIEFEGSELNRRTAVVEIKSPVADAAGQTVRIKLQIANPDLSLIPGSKVFIVLDHAAPNAMTDGDASDPASASSTDWTNEGSDHV